MASLSRVQFPAAHSRKQPPMRPLPIALARTLRAGSRRLPMPHRKCGCLVACLVCRRHPFDLKAIFMKQIVRRLWCEDDGVLSFEWTIMAVVIAFGIVGGLA